MSKTTSPSKADSRLVSIAYGEDYLDVSRSTIYRLIDAGHLQSVKVGRSNKLTHASLEAVARSGAALPQPAAA